jgi:transposase-like protein
MSRKRTIYSAEFKSKLVLEVLKNEKTLQEMRGVAIFAKACFD